MLYTVHDSIKNMFNTVQFNQRVYKHVFPHNRSDGIVNSDEREKDRRYKCWRRGGALERDKRRRATRFLRELSNTTPDSLHLSLSARLVQIVGWESLIWQRRKVYGCNIGASGVSSVNYAKYQLEKVCISRVWILYRTDFRNTNEHDTEDKTHEKQTTSANFMSPTDLNSTSSSDIQLSIKTCWRLHASACFLMLLATRYIKI